MAHNGVVLVYAHNRAGEQFVQALRVEGRSNSIVTCHSAEQLQSDKEKFLNNPSENEFSKVYIFEEELEECCKVLEILRKWTCGTIYVITKKHYPQMIYKVLGADYVIRTTNEDLSFLIEKGVI